MKIIEGDLIRLAQEGAFDAVVHGCNCFCTMGAGIAKSIRAAFPEAYRADQATPRGERAKLGSCSLAEILVGEGRRLVVVNAYTQYDWRGRGSKVDYDAVRSCMRWVKERHAGRRIGIPKIGAGLAGGDWPTLAGIIDEELAGEDLTLVEYRP